MNAEAELQRGFEAPVVSSSIDAGVVVMKSSLRRTLYSSKQNEYALSRGPQTLYFQA